MKKIGIITMIILFLNIKVLFAPLNASFDYNEMVENFTLSIKKQLIGQVENYIKKNSNNSKINAKVLVETCLLHDFDIVLTLSQAHLESHFGTKGVAKRTNSVFNVGTYDNGVILYKYNTPDLSIEPYIKLLKRSYLVNNKTPQDLLKDYSFVNYNGLRYASFKYYEKRLRDIYYKIIQTTNIQDFQDKLTKLKEINSNVKFV